MLQHLPGAMNNQAGEISTCGYGSQINARCQGEVSPDTKFCRLIPTLVLPFNPDTSFAAQSRQLLLPV